jgi:hypothetical protein
MSFETVAQRLSKPGWMQVKGATTDHFMMKDGPQSQIVIASERLSDYRHRNTVY